MFFDMVGTLTIGVLVILIVDRSETQQLKKDAFSCDGRTSGYYADVSTGCQVYHMCDGLGRQFTYTCPNATLFQQRMLICDHWYMVNCSKSIEDYSANLLIGQNKPFVEDSETNHYSRTPRPDLLTANNIIFRTGHDQSLTTRNVVGFESDKENSTDDPTYFPPSHWSTELSKQSETVPTRNNYYQENKNVFRTNYNSASRRRGGSSFTKTKAKAIQVDAQNRNGFDLPSNKDLLPSFKSNFKATTPVYPSSVDDTTSSPNNIGLLPPIIPNGNSKIDAFKELPQQKQHSDTLGRRVQLDSTPDEGASVHSPSRYKATTPVYPSVVHLTRDFKDPILGGLQPPQEGIEAHINFDSNFKATTPQYPTFVDATSPDLEGAGLIPPKKNKFVNFESRFKATTPQYPTYVDASSPNPSDIGLLPPKDSKSVNFESNFKATTPQYPKYVDPSSPNPFDVGVLPPKDSKLVNFESNFKATTPQYPTYVDPSSPNPFNVGVLPPKDSKFVNFESNFKATTPQYPTYVDPSSPNPFDVGVLPPKDSKGINFQSNFKATTPQYPNYVDPSSLNPSDVGLLPPKDSNFVNFESNFKATTPQYPKSVDATSPLPDQVGLLPPRAPNLATPGLILGYKSVKSVEHPDTSNDFSSLPSKFYQPPNFNSDFAEDEADLQETPGLRIANFMKSFNQTQWQDLRKVFRIPEYDFPLDDATRPSYDSVVNSFEPKSLKKR